MISLLVYSQPLNLISIIVYYILFSTISINTTIHKIQINNKLSNIHGKRMKITLRCYSWNYRSSVVQSNDL